MNVRSPRVVVTGASAGVGRAVARVFAQEGAHIGLLARCRDRLEAARREVEEAFGPMDVWINNAMASVFSPIQQMTPAEFKRVTEVTYLG